MRVYNVALVKLESPLTCSVSLTSSRLTMYGPPPLFFAGIQLTSLLVN